MKSIFKFTLLIFSLVCYTTNSFAQEWYDLIREEPVDLEAVQKSAKICFDKIGRGKHTGYKQYARWLDKAIGNMDKNGVPYTHKYLSEKAEEFKTNTSNRRQKTTALSAINATTDADGTWTPMGPSFAPENRDSKRLGKVEALAVEPTEQKLMFIGSRGGGIWRSRDAGDSWTPLGDDFDNMEILGIGIDPHNSNHIVYYDSNNEIYESLDQGDTWTQIANYDTFDIYSKTIKFHPTISGIYFITTRVGLIKTTDGGKTFKTVLKEDNEEIYFKPGDVTTMYSSGDDFWKSTDTGDTWTKITNGIEDSERMKMAVTEADPERVYIIQEFEAGFGRVYRSTDSGESFIVVSDYNTIGEDKTYLGIQAYRCMTIMCSNTDPDKLHMGGLDHFRSDDGGNNLYKIEGSGSINSPAYIHSDVLTMQNINGTLYATSDGGAYRSTDNGENYIPLTGGLMTSQFYRIGGTSPFPGTGEGLDPHMVVGGTQDNGSKVSKGEDNVWENWIGSDGMENCIDYTNQDRIYGSKQEGVIMYSSNGGRTSYPINRPEGDSEGGWITPFEMDPVTPTTLYVGFKDLYISKDSVDDTDWVKMTSGQSGGSKLDEIAIAPSDNNYIYFADKDRLWASNNAQSDARVWTERFGFEGYVRYISVDPNDPSHVVICNTGSRIYESNDAGATWTNIFGNLPEITVDCVLIDNSDENRIYAGMTQGVYYKDDTMTEWELFGNGLPKYDVRELEIHYASKKLRAATYGRGVWEIPIFGSESTQENTLSVSTLNEFNAESNNQTITVTSNIDWTVSENSSWVSVDIASGTNNGAIVVTANENASTDDRSTDVIINGGGLSRSITITQKGAEEVLPISSLVVSTLNEFSADGGAQTITVESNIDWDASENSAWVTLDSTSGSNNDSISVSVNENTATDDRSAVITITGDGISRSITVTQNGAPEVELPAVNYTSIPALIQAEDFDSQSGTQTEPSSDFRGGQNIGYINEADFLTYNINVIESGNYIIDFRVASPLIRGVNFDIYSEDSIIGSVSSNTTGGWQIWETVSQTVSLNKGMQTIKLVATNNGGWNINWLEFYQEQENVIDTVIPSNSCPEGTNLSLIGTVIDFSSEQNTTNNISNLIDGIDTNRWSVNGFPQFATIDLGEEYPISEVNLATFQNRDYQFIAEGATNASPDDFFTLVDASDNTDTGIIKRIFSAQAVRYVKLTITGANSYTGPWSSIADFKIICAGDISNKNSFAPNADLFEITAFPNPLTDAITVSMANEEQIIGSLQLTDLMGRLIIEETVNANEHTLNNLDSVASGAYLLLVFNTEKQILKTIKIVIE